MMPLSTWPRFALEIYRRDCYTVLCKSMVSVGLTSSKEYFPANHVATVSFIRISFEFILVNVKKVKNEFKTSLHIYD